jgi:glycosyltransferase involved in cell wall biosynthesis
LHTIADLDPRKGGPTVVCVGLAKLMAQRGHRVCIVTTDRGFEPPGSLGDGAVRIDALPGSWPAFFGTSWPMWSRLSELVREADVVHLHALYLFHDLATGHFCRRFDKPYILTPHGVLDPFIYRRHRGRKRILELAFQNRVLREAAGIHYTAAEEYELARGHAANARGCIIPIGIDLDPYRNLPPRDTLRRRYPAIGDRKVVLFLGRLSFKKGVDVAVEAFANVARRHEDAFLVIAGPDDGVQSDASALLERYGLHDRSLFTGMVTGVDKLTVFAGSDVFVLPSQSENFGISVVEAAACGIPVVISDRVNLWRDFQEANAGLVAPPTAREFSRHLDFLLENSDAAAEMGRRGIVLARRFSWEALGPQYEVIYKRVAETGTLPELAKVDL